MAGSGYSQDVVAVNVFDNAALEARTRTNRQGQESTRYTVTIAAEPIAFDFTDEALCKGPAEAIAELLRKKIRGIGEAASPATLQRRKNAVEGLAAGVASYVRRYSGGRLGTKPPNQTVRLFNDSGRLADGIVVMANKVERAFTINVAANRFDPTTFGGGQGALINMWQRLVSLVPEFKGGPALLANQEIRDAVEDATVDAIYVMRKNGEAAIKSARWQLISAITRDTIKLAGF